MLISDRRCAVPASLLLQVLRSAAVKCGLRLFREVGGCASFAGIDDGEVEFVKRVRGIQEARRA